jgi:fluoride ion exporter CrcB/FEX
VLVGDSGVGKSSILRRWATGSFSKEYVSTVGADFVNPFGPFVCCILIAFSQQSKTIEFKGKRVQLQLVGITGKTSDLSTLHFSGILLDKRDSELLQKCIIAGRMHFCWCTM